MSASTVIAINAQTQAIIAQQQARQANCRVTEIQFDNSKTHSVQEKKAYASCIDTLYLSAGMSGMEIVIIKVLIASVFVGIGVGIWYAKYVGETDPVTYVGSGFIGGLIIPLSVFIFGLLMYGVIFLFS